MAVHDPELEGYGRRIRRWLGIDPAGDRDADAPDRDRERLPPRSRLMQQIERFLDDLDLDVSATSLAVAYDCLTGANPRLARIIADRRMRGRIVSQTWLEQAMREAGHDNQSAAAGGLIERLEHMIAEFGSNTHSAREAARDYKQALGHHVDKLEASESTEAVIAELLTLSRTMLDRTLQIENRLERSERRTIELKRSLQKARATANIDHLTGLPNRRAFDRLFEEQFRSARANRAPLCLAFCDIDHFKDVNDRHGHPAGDRVLRMVAEMLARISDDKCHVARHGGEEFAVLFCGITLEDARVRLDATRAELAARRLVNRATDEPFGQISFSAGITDALAWPGRRVALKAADEALYKAKRAGRNRIVVAHHP